VIHFLHRMLQETWNGAGKNTSDYGRINAVFVTDDDARKRCLRGSLPYVLLLPNECSTTLQLYDDDLFFFVLEFQRIYDTSSYILPEISFSGPNVQNDLSSFCMLARLLRTSSVAKNSAHRKTPLTKTIF
jgi:hypothetical protein